MTYTAEKLGVWVVLLGLAAGVRTGSAGQSGLRAALREAEVRRQYAGELGERSRRRRETAHARAARQGWRADGRSGHTLWRLMGINGDEVRVYKTLNVNAAISVGAAEIRWTAPYDLDGAGERIGVWDAGAVRATHREFGGRVIVKEALEAIDHATHIAGTIGAAGVTSSALGMAPEAAIDSYDFGDDVSEMVLAAMSYAGEEDKLQVSNHSYGTVCGWDYLTETPRWYGRRPYRESDMFGRYDSEARERDEVCYGAPYYLPFISAGNDRNDGAPEEGAVFEYYSFRLGWVEKEYDPLVDPWDDGWDDGGFDTMLPASGAKNVVTVGAVADAVTNGVRDSGKARMTSFSGWGPTDDGRIKPDIVANGTGVYSAAGGSDTAYVSYSGASMATACASGASLLLTEYYGELFEGGAMRSSTLKGLIIHTADDLGRRGPDYEFGWGLMNVKAAAEQLRRHREYGRVHGIVEDVVDGEAMVRRYTFFRDGDREIRATLAWTDPAAPAVSGLDNSSRRLVNDLDLRIVDPCGVVHYPFVLNPGSPAAEAGTGDNTLDNVEQVAIEGPGAAGVYTAWVEYKGALVNGEQEYSLLLSGQSDVYVSPADFDGDGDVDLLDLAVLAAYWLGDEESADIWPVDGDSIIDFGDFARFGEELGKGK